jgi:hypothetical protein
MAWFPSGAEAVAVAVTLVESEELVTGVVKREALSSA